jgi:hypothetical protein
MVNIAHSVADIIRTTADTDHNIAEISRNKAGTSRQQTRATKPLFSLKILFLLKTVHDGKSNILHF